MFEATYPGLEHVHLSNSMGTPQNVMLEQLAWARQGGHALVRGEIARPRASSRAHARPRPRRFSSA